MDFEKRIRELFLSNDLQHRHNYPVGPVYLEYWDNGQKHLLLQDLMVDHTKENNHSIAYRCGWKHDFEIGVDEMEKVADECIGIFKNLKRQRDELLSLGFEPLGLRNSLFCFVLHVRNHAYTASQCISFNSSNGVFYGNIPVLMTYELNTDPVQESFKSKELVRAVIEFFKRQPLEEKLLLPKELRDRLV